MTDDVVRTDRLVLTPLSCTTMRAVLAGDWATLADELGTDFPLEWRGDGWTWLRPLLAAGEQDPQSLGWGTRLARPLSGGPVLAEVGGHGTPDVDGWVEIGYRVVARYRRQGYAAEAVRGLLDWTAAHGVAGVRAAVSPGNDVSMHLLRRLGFAPAGRREHAVLGEQLLFEKTAG